MGTISTRFTPGTVLGGKYRVEEVLGEGGMGVVLRATHMLLDEPVALKLLLPELVHHPEAVPRFLREAKAAMRIRGEHVAQVLDAGQLDEGEPYIVMEYLDGLDLEVMLEERGPLPVREAVDAVLQACRALHGAHAAGVVHRDIKPANLFATTTASGQPLIKVLDFGISKLSGEKVGSLTKTDTTMGSALYMSPEQLVSSRDVDLRTDIYALGVTLYQLLTGSFPFMGETIPQLVAEVLNGTPQPLRPLRPEVPRGLAAVIARAMARDADDRHPSIAAFAAALAPFASAMARVRLTSFVSLESLGEASLVAPLGTAPLGAAPLGAAPPTAVPSAAAADPVARDSAPNAAPRDSASNVVARDSAPNAVARDSAPNAAGPATASTIAGPTMASPTRAAPTRDGPTIPKPAAASPAGASPVVTPAVAALAALAPSNAVPRESADTVEATPAVRGTRASSPGGVAPQAPIAPLVGASTAAPTSRTLDDPNAPPRPRWLWPVAAAAALLSVIAIVAFASLGEESSPVHAGASTAAANASVTSQVAADTAAGAAEAPFGIDEVASARPASSAAPASCATPASSAKPSATPAASSSVQPSPRPPASWRGKPAPAPANSGSIFDSFD